MMNYFFGHGRHNRFDMITGAMAVYYGMTYSVWIGLAAFVIGLFISVIGEDILRKMR